MIVSFFVPGKPQTAGSKRAFPFKRKDGRLGVAVSDDNPKGRDWKAMIVDRFLQMAGGKFQTPHSGPIKMTIEFRFARPKSHFRSDGKTLKTMITDTMHTQRPDATKLVRCFEDALNGVAWNDDSQICNQAVFKRWTNDSEHQGVQAIIHFHGADDE